MYEFPYGAGQQINLNWIINEIITLHKRLDPDWELPNFYNAFPYMNLNQLNLDWILRELKAIKDLAPAEDTQLLKMVANALIANTYDAETQYNVNDIVYRDTNNRLYKCITATPAGGEPFDNNKWLEIDVGGTLTDLLTNGGGAVPSSRTVNGKPLSSNITLNASDIPNDSNVTGANLDDALNNLNDASLRFKRELTNGEDLNALYENGWYLTGSSHTYLNSPIPNDSGQREILVTGVENPTATSYRVMYYANRTRKIYAHRVFAAGSWSTWNIQTDNLNYKRCLLIGDSYNNGNGGISGQGWGYYFQQFTGCEATIVHQNGGGFAIAGNSNSTYPNKTFAQCVSEINGEFDLIIAQSGWNDAGQATIADIKTNVAAFITAAKNKWRNAKIYVISINNGTDTTYTKANKLKAISDAALENDTISSIYSPYWLIGKNVAATDGIHLNDNGYKLLAHYIVDYVSGWDGVIEANNYYNVPNDDRIPPATVTVGTNVSCYFNNSFCTISFDVTLTQTESSWVTTVQNLPIPRAYLIQTIGNWNATYQRPIRAEIGNDGIIRIRYGEAGNYRILLTYPL